MRLVSWNVNGVRAVMKKGFPELLAAMNTDVICLQETKAQDEQVAEALKEIKGYHLYSNSAVKKGYSGTAIFTIQEPLAVSFDMGVEEHDQEGRVIAAEFADFYLVTVYTPNSGNGLKRLEYRQQWDKEFLLYLQRLESKKPVVVCGDLNVAHKDIDLARPKPNYNKNPGYMQAEIDGIDNLTTAGFVDTFRYMNPDKADRYSWWSYRAGARGNNVGWRIDYFLCSRAYLPNVTKADILSDVMGSDHCPVFLELS